MTFEGIACPLRPAVLGTEIVAMECSPEVVNLEIEQSALLK